MPLIVKWPGVTQAGSRNRQMVQNLDYAETFLEAGQARIPDDIPVDGSTDDQVAEQIREAALAEEDPLIRDALWEEYRKHTGIKQ